MKVIKIEKDGPKTFFVCWTLHDFCNFRCSYCPPGLNQGNRRAVTFEHVKKFYTVLRSKIGTETKLIIAFSGGEPTLHPEFIEIVKFLREHNCEVTMTTNGGKGLDWWEEIEPHIVNLVISYHPEFSNFNKIYEKVKFLSETCWVNVDFMMDPTRWDEVVGYANEFKKFKKNVGVVHLPIQQNFGTLNEGLLSTYTAEQREFLANPPNYYGDYIIPDNKRKQSGGFVGRGPMSVSFDNGVTEKLDYKKLIGQDINQFTGMTCNIGLEGLILEFADVYRGYCHVGGKVANLLDEDFDLPIDPVICNKVRCACSVDIEVSKF
jgi:organic radical activating enzyme